MKEESNKLDKVMKDWSLLKEENQALREANNIHVLD